MAVTCLAGAVWSGQVAFAQSGKSTQVPKSAQSTTTDTDTTGSVAKSGDHPKMGVDPKCKEVLANQAGHDADEIKACGQKSE